VLFFDYFFPSVNILIKTFNLTINFQFNGITKEGSFTARHLIIRQCFFVNPVELTLTKATRENERERERQRERERERWNEISRIGRTEERERREWKRKKREREKSSFPFLVISSKAVVPDPTKVCFALQTTRCAMLTWDRSTLNEGKHPPLPACESLSFGVS